jgi:hypothetical protein
VRIDLQNLRDIGNSKVQKDIETHIILYGDYMQLYSEFRKNGIYLIVVRQNVSINLWNQLKVIFKK